MHTGTASGSINNKAEKFIGPVQEEIGAVNMAIDTLSMLLHNLMEKLEPVLGCELPNDGLAKGGSPSHCEMHAKLMGVTDRITGISAFVSDLSNRIKL